MNLQRIRQPVQGNDGVDCNVRGVQPPAAAVKLFQTSVEAEIAYFDASYRHGPVDVAPPVKRRVIHETDVCAP